MFDKKSPEGSRKNKLLATVDGYRGTAFNLLLVHL